MFGNPQVTPANEMPVNLNSWTSKKVQEKILSAYKELVREDSFLLKYDVNERSLTHCLATHLEKYFPGYDIDCEYNRDGIGTSPKRISKIRDLDSFRQNVSPEDDSGITVYPDIIIHKRGAQSGLVVIEAKKSKCRPNDDMEKLKLYKKDLGYPYAFFVKFPVKTSLIDVDYEDLIKEITTT